MTTMTTAKPGGKRVAAIAPGEVAVISVLREQRATINENFAGFSLTEDDGTTITA